MSRWALRSFPLRSALALVAAVALAGTLAAAWRIRSSVRRVLDAPVSTARPLSFAALEPPRSRVDFWGTGEVAAVVFTPGGLLTAGGSGVRFADGRSDHDGLPSLRTSALALWRRTPVVALEAGGLFRRGPTGWEEVRSGFGLLHVRALVETEAGELLVGAREGLFRAAWGSTSLERLDTNPVRTVAAGAGFVLAGGEEGLFRTDAGRTLRLETPDPWIESLGLDGDRLFVATAAGLAQGRLGGALTRLGGGEDVASGVAHGGRYWGVTADGRLLRIDPEGGVGEEHLPAVTRRVMTAAGELFADTDAGLYQRTREGWRSAVARPAALPPGSAHVSALAWRGERLVAGFFDGGLAEADLGAQPLAWRFVPGSAAWGVNALLAAGGALYVASLRGAARYDGQRLTALDGPGAAFSLATTDDGVAVGYGQGVLLPGSTLLSAFHGLPGNQALALASGQSLFVGTPSGLGALSGRRVRWRVTAGEGRLPNPWVTALAAAQDGLYVGTYGGGVVRREASATAGGVAPPGRASDSARYEPFPETEGLKVNPGCLVEAGGRLFLGTDGKGVFRLSSDRKRFEAWAVPLPSPRVTALLPGRDALWVGTDEGLARLALGSDTDGRQ
jgi:hypothetical protein